LAEAHLFVHASEVELEGMAVLEAVGAGLPVLVANARESAARQFASGPDFLFRAGDPADLAAHLDRAIDAPAALTRASRRSVELAAHHDFARCARELEAVYESVAGAPVRVPARARGA